VQDIPGSNVNEPDVQPTDSPVMTSDVAAAGIVHRPSAIGSVVEAAFDAHAGRLKGFALAAVRDPATADDLVQETFLRYIRQVRAYGEPDNVGGWLHRVCANLVASRGRHQGVAARSRFLLVERGAGDSAEDQVVRSDEGSRLRSALAGLPQDARVALLMAAAGFSSAEIGEAIGRTANATSTYICRARIRLRELLADPGGSSP